MFGQLCQKFGLLLISPSGHNVEMLVGKVVSYGFMRPRLIVLGFDIEGDCVGWVSGSGDEKMLPFLMSS